jgi:D-alanyl-D-alanine dipeptidase
LLVSNHLKGLAVDLTLANYDGTYLDMGTDFDDFSERAHVDSALITPDQQANRKILQTAMEAHGYKPWPYEWWHFDYPATLETE